MIVRTLDEIMKSKDRYVKFGKSESRRFLLKADGMGFSVTDGLVYDGAEGQFWWKHHIMSNYFIEGEGEIEVLEPERKSFQIRPGTMFACNKHEKFIIRVRKKIRNISVITPPFRGFEVPGADGIFPPSD
jgi:L-ectoine synthase